MNEERPIDSPAAPPGAASQVASPLDVACPVPDSGGGLVTLAMGGGGRATERLIETYFRPAFTNEWLDVRHDGALLEAGQGRLAFTTDSYVVRPLEFPGGDIGRLAVYGTVNDLAVCGARPAYLSAGFILEEGFALDALDRIIASMATAARECGVQIVTGDTKVVERGKGDGVYINTAGVGLYAADGRVEISPAGIRPGNRILVSGDVGRHGAAILACREGLSFESVIESDAASVAPPVRALLEAGGSQVRCLRDLTRGGLAAALVELAGTARLQLRLEGAPVPVRQDVRSACEVLGLDPLHLACEGRFVAFVEETFAAEALAILKRFDPSAADVGVCSQLDAEDPFPGVIQLSALGVARVLDMPEGENLPRIC